MNAKFAYLLLAIAGGVVPYAFFFQHFQQHGYNLAAFAEAVFANAAAGGFAADLIIASAVFWIMMIREYRSARAPAPAPFIVLNLLIGLSCALPAWLYARLAYTAPIDTIGGNA